MEAFFGALRMRAEEGTKAAYHGAFSQLRDAPLHPSATRYRLHLPAVERPARERQGVRGNIEEWARAGTTSRRASISRRISGGDYFEVYLRYREHYHHRFPALSGRATMRQRNSRDCPMAARLKRQARSRLLARSLGTRVALEEFSEPGSGEIRHREWDPAGATRDRAGHRA